MSAKLQRREYETKQRADCADDTNKYIETSIISTVVDLYMKTNQDYTNVTKLQLQYSLAAKRTLKEWGRDIIKAHNPADFQRVAKVYENNEYLCYPDVYEKLINLTMNLDIIKGVK